MVVGDTADQRYFCQVWNGSPEVIPGMTLKHAGKAHFLCCLMKHPGLFCKLINFVRLLTCKTGPQNDYDSFNIDAAQNNLH